MAEPEEEPTTGQVPQNRLADAIKRVRADQANRDDVVVEMKQAASARLEILADELRPVFDDLGNRNEQFEFGLSHGETPRLWIDLTTHVRMGRDPRRYEFVKDTRNGRIILGESPNSEKIAKQIADYVAERVLAHERAIEGEWQEMRSPAPADAGPEQRAGDQGINSRRVLSFVLGLLIGAGGMVAWAWFSPPPL